MTMALLGRPPWDNCPLHTRLGAWPGQYSLRRELRSRIQVLLASNVLSCIFICSPRAFILRSLYLTSWDKVFFRCLCYGLLMRRGRRKLEDNFPHSDSVPTSVLLLVLPLHPPPYPRVHKTSRGLFMEMTSTSVLFYLTLDQSDIPWRKMEQCFLGY